MLKIMKALTKWKCGLYLLFAGLYSFQGLAVSVIIQLAGELSFDKAENIVFFGLFGVLLFVFIYLFMLADNILLRSIIKDFNIRIAQKALAGFYQKSLDWSSADLDSFLSQDIPLFWQEYLIPLLIYPVWGLSILVSVLYLISQNVFIGSLFAVGGSLMVIPQFLFSHQLKVRGKELSRSKKDSLAAIRDFSKGIWTIRSNQAGRSFSHKVIKDISKTEEAQCRYYTSHNIVMFWTGPLKGIGLVLPFVIGLFTMGQSKGTVTTLIAMMTASANFISPLQQLLEATSSLQSSSQIKKKMLKILPQEEDIESPIPSQEKFLTIRMVSVSKAFPGKPILKRADLTVRPKEHILLTGASGSGKSTVFNLLTGEDEDFSGDIVFVSAANQVLAPSYDLVSLIHQRPYIFSDSLRNNLTLFQGYSEKELVEVLQKVRLWEELSYDLDAPLNVHHLSGGQAMKLEIARNLLRHKPILLADEITASLDADSAREIRTILQKLPVTVVEIAHKYDFEQYDAVYRLKQHCFIQQ